MRNRRRDPWAKRARRRLWLTTIACYALIVWGWWHCAGQSELRSTLTRYRAYVYEHSSHALNYLPPNARKP